MRKGAILKRDNRIDTLRALAITSIILAHSGPPNLLFQLRTFDVPMMSFLMGASFVISEQKNTEESLKKYIWKRFKRLVLPTWVFLSLYFIIMSIEYLVLNRDIPFTKEIILSSYTLESGIGYVWIIKVFLIISLLSPIIFKISKTSNTITKTSIYLLIMLAIQFVFCKLFALFTGEVNNDFQSYIVTPFGYLIMTFIGMKATEQTFKENCILSQIIMCLFFFIGINKNIGQLQLFKYPPAPYYLLYGLSVSMVIYNFLSIEKIGRVIKKFNFISWISKHSLELYYWHILVLTNINLLKPETSFKEKFVLLIIGTLILTITQLSIFPNLLSGKFPSIQKKTS